MSSIDYDTSELLIQYNNNNEYRKIIRKLFKFDSDKLYEKYQEMMFNVKKDINYFIF